MSEQDPVAPLTPLDGGLLYGTIEQLEQTQAQLLKLLRAADIVLEPARREDFNRRLREIKHAAASIAGRVQLLIWRSGVDVDRRHNPDRRAARRHDLPADPL